MKITDEMLYRHAAEARDIWLDTLPDDNEIPEHQFSDEFNKEMDRLITLSHKRKQPSRRLQRIAAMFAVIIIGASSFIGVNAEARAAFVGWVKEVTGNLFVYRYEGEADVNVVPEDYRPAWLPDGYTEFFVDDTEDTVSVAYANEAGEILHLSYIHNPDETTWFVNTSNTVQKDANVNGAQADMFISTDSATSSAIMWVDQYNTAFMISAFLDEETLIYVAEHIEPVDLTDANVSEPTVSTPQKYELTLIPDGYSLVYERDREDSRSLLYGNESGQMIKYHCLAPESSTEGFIAVENITQKTAEVNGHHADLFVSNDAATSSCVVWTDEHNYTHALHAFFDEDALIELAESVKINER